MKDFFFKVEILCLFALTFYYIIFYFNYYLMKKLFISKLNQTSSMTGATFANIYKLCKKMNNVRLKIHNNLSLNVNDLAEKHMINRGYI